MKFKKIVVFIIILVLSLTISLVPCFASFTYSSPTDDNPLIFSPSSVVLYSPSSFDGYWVIPLSNSSPSASSYGLIIPDDSAVEGLSSNMWHNGDYYSSYAGFGTINDSTIDAFTVYYPDFTLIEEHSNSNTFSIWITNRADEFGDPSTPDILSYVLSFVASTYVDNVLVTNSYSFNLTENFIPNTSNYLYFSTDYLLSLCSINGSNGTYFIDNLSVSVNSPSCYFTGLGFESKLLDAYSITYGHVLPDTISSPPDQANSLFSAFTAFGEWFGSMISNFLSLFFNSDGLTILGGFVVSIIGLAFVALMFKLIFYFLSFGG